MKSLPNLIILTGFLMLVETQAWASSCAEMRMDEPGGSMEHVKVRDQKQLGICFAETGAQILDAIRFSRLGDTNYAIQTSGAAIAAGISVERKVNAFAQGGQACWSLDYAKRNGVCARSVVEEAPSDSVSSIAQTEMQENIRMLLMTQNVFSRPFARDPATSAQCAATGSGLRPAPEQGFDAETMFKLMSSTANVAGTHARITQACRPAPPRATAVNPFEKVNLSCSPFRSRAKPDAQAKAKDYSAVLHGLMDKPRALPVEIHFCANFISGSTNRSTGGDPDSCGAHAALIIGRRNVGGKCQLLVRNSWGTECAHYSDAVRAGCEEGRGNVWIDEDVLLKKTLGVVPPPEV